MPESRAWLWLLPMSVLAFHPGFVPHSLWPRPGPAEDARHHQLLHRFAHSTQSPDWHHSGNGRQNHWAQNGSSSLSFPRSSGDLISMIPVANHNVIFSSVVSGLFALKFRNNWFLGDIQLSDVSRHLATMSCTHFPCWYAIISWLNVFWGYLKFLW